MNSHQRRCFRRAIDALLPPGTRVMHKYRADRAVWIVRTRNTVFERREYNRVLVQKEVAPFGHHSVNVNNIRLAP